MNPPAFGPSVLFLALLLCLTLPASASAQYMFLDSDGDGSHTAADVLHGTGPTVVDVWIDIGHNRDGSATSCTANPSQPLNMSEYQFALQASGGTVNFSAFTNRLAQFAPFYSSRMDSTRFDSGGIGAPPGVTLPPGKYLLGTFTVNAVSGTPSLQIVPEFTMGFITAYTLFGSSCDGTAYPNSIALGINWTDVDGLAFSQGGMANRPPSLVHPANMTILVGEHATQSLTATDADGQPLSFTKESGPPFLSVQTTDVGAGTATGEIRLAPFASDIGTHTGTVRVSDGEAADQASFIISVNASADHAPHFLAVPTLTVVAGRVAKVILNAGDPDGGTLHFSDVSGPRYVALTELIAHPGGACAAMRANPTLCDVGAATARVAVTDGTSQAQVDVAVNVLSPAPAPSTPNHSTSNSELDDASRVGDLNGDGKPDVVITYESRAQVTVYLGLGDGTFGPGANYDIPTRAHDIVLADLNRDGKLDVAVPSTLGADVSVFLGRGDGTLLPASRYATGSGPLQIAAADADGDGILDLITLNEEGGTVSVLIGNGDGTFQPRRDSAAGTKPKAMAIGDFNVDGRLDVALVNEQVVQISVLPGLGDGFLGDAVPTPASGFFIALVAGDWNGDGILDLAGTDLGTPALKTYAGHGDGTFSPAATVASLLFPYGCAAADMDGDGNLDLVVAENGRASALVFRGNGNGGFAAPVPLGPIPAQIISLGDLNSDGMPDIVSPGGFGFSVQLNTFAATGTAAEARAFVSTGHQGNFESNFESSNGNGIEIRLEPVHGSYANEQVDLGSVTLSSEGTGSVSQIHSIVPRRVIVADTDRNGVAEIGVTFARSDLRALFDRIDRPTNVTAELRGSILDGRAFCAGVVLRVKQGPGNNNSVAFSPNPLNPGSKLTFSTTLPGAARAQIFDIQGRLVRTLLDVPRLDAGDHEVAFDGRSARGTPLSSGVLFYKLTSVDGTFGGRLVILK